MERNRASSWGQAGVWPAVVGAVLFNIAPVLGVLFGGWTAFALIYLYWAENLAIGARTLGSMAGAALLGGRRRRARLAFIGPFFIVHYGMFCFVHGAFILSTFGGELLQGASSFDLWNAARVLIAQHPNLAWGLASIGAWQAVLLIVFLIRGEARRSEPTALMMSPYPRIVILHLTIILGGGLVMLLGQPVAGLLLLTLAKMAFDIAEVLGRETLFIRLPSRAG